MNEDEIAVLRRQILAIRDTGKTNMCSIREVQRLANDSHYFELVMFLEEHRSNYFHVIATGRFYEEEV